MDLITGSDRRSLYIKTLMKRVMYCDDVKYHNITNSLTYRVLNNLENTPIIRKKIVHLKKSNPSESIIKRCDDLLEYYKL